MRILKKKEVKCKKPLKKVTDTSKLDDILISLSYNHYNKNINYCDCKYCENSPLFYKKYSNIYHHSAGNTGEFVG